jgi:NTE family protein
MSRTKTKIGLALQGGGAHGAFTWGVVDRLLEADRFEIAGISGTSAGAVNAVAIADGYLEGGAEAARAKLGELWQVIAEKARMSPVKRTPLNIWLGNWSLDNSPGYAFVNFLSRYVSPYDFNPLGINPLRTVLSDMIDFERIRRSDAFRIFISATNVRDGNLRVFRNEEVSADAVLASASLPNLFQAVEIDGESYWDGGYTGNPAMFPYIYECDADDVVLVQINPVNRADIPRTAQDIANRVDEITFNTSLQREMRAIEFVSSMIKRGARLPGGFRPLRIHRIDGEDGLENFSASSKINAERGFVTHLFELGRRTGEKWLAGSGKSVGRRSGYVALTGMAMLPEMPGRKKAS